MCGVFGVFNHPEASKLSYLGLYALQHRGQESAGIASSCGKKIHSYVQMGLVADIFNNDNLLKLKGNSAIGHVRYSTTGMSQIKNAQPLVINYTSGQLGMAHNGNLINASSLRKKLEKDGSIFSTSTDTEVILHLMACSGKSKIEDAMRSALKQVKGAYSLIAITPEKIIAARDPDGFRPLVLGKLNNSYVLSSETCALDLINAKYVRDIKPGEMITISKSGIKSIKFSKVPAKSNFCIFEYIYFSRPDSIVSGKSIHTIREKMGKQIAHESIDKIGNADLVISVPDSANSAAMGFSKASGIPYESGFIRNHYIGRTFIEPNQQIRDFGAKIKYNPVKDVLNNKKVVVVDDSIVRGTTSRKLVKMLKNAGAKEVHLAISSPAIIAPCFYGIDTPTKNELIAHKYSIEQIRKYLGVKTLNYLSIKGLIKATACVNGGFCVSCFNGKYCLK